MKKISLTCKTYPNDDQDSHLTNNDDEDLASSSSIDDQKCPQMKDENFSKVMATTLPEILVNTTSTSLQTNSRGTITNLVLGTGMGTSN